MHSPKAHYKKMPGVQCVTKYFWDSFGSFLSLIKKNFVCFHFFNKVFSFSHMRKAPQGPPPKLGDLHDEEFWLYRESEYIEIPNFLLLTKFNADVETTTVKRVVIISNSSLHGTIYVLINWYLRIPLTHGRELVVEEDIDLKNWHAIRTVFTVRKK